MRIPGQAPAAPSRRRRLLTILTFALATASSGLAGVSGGQPDSTALRQLYDQRQFFALRDALAQIPDLATAQPEIRFFQAASQQAFNQPAASNDTVETLLADLDLEIDLIAKLRTLQLTNYLRLHRYREGLATAKAILTAIGDDPHSPAVVEARSKAPLFLALADVPPQTVEIRGASRLALGKTRRVPLKIDGQKRAFALDTGANLSVIMRSEAAALGLEIRPTHLVISTSTARQVTGDLAVARDVEIGRIRYSHVVFLVLPDELLTFAKGQRIPGLIGFPLVDAMGEVRLRRDHVLEIPKEVPRRSPQNLALDDLDPLVQVRYGRDVLLCRLDTGAADTVFYEPFFRLYGERIESVGRRVTAKATGVGGMQEIDAFRLPTMALTIADAGINLRRVEVYTESIRRPEENILHCNVGRDALEKFAAYTLNLRHMALILE